MNELRAECRRQGKEENKQTNKNQNNINDNNKKSMTFCICNNQLKLHHLQEE